MNLRSCKALVTGGAVRIGRAICEALAAKGCDVVVHCNASQDKADELVRVLRQENVRAFVVKGDLTSRATCRRVLEEAWEKAEGIDFLINNAAVFHKDSLMSATEEMLMTELMINFMAPMRLTFALAEKMGVCRDENGLYRVPGKDMLNKCAGRQVNKAAVINLLDRRIAGTGLDCLSYFVSKNMLAEFTKTAAMELAPYVRVNGVAPGAVLAPPAASRVRDVAGPVPLGSGCMPADTACAVVFLLESDYITGHTIFVDGGQHLNNE